ncbi:MAG: phospholipase [Novosphingobium sp.]|nr:phospholipase [Novosphingobium sp.]
MIEAATRIIRRRRPSNGPALSRILALPVIALVTLPCQAVAKEPVEILLSRAGTQTPDGMALVDIRLLNPGDAPQNVAMPQRVEAQISSEDSKQTVWLERTPETSASLTIAPGAFASARYMLPAGEVPDDAMLSVPAWGGQQIAVTSVQSDPKAATPQLADATDATQPPPPAPPGDKTFGNAFLNNLTAYEPIYGVFGPGTNTEARIQISFKYKIYGKHGEDEQSDGFSPADGLYFGYTQRMFWNLGADSSPFRNIDFQPEVFYLSPSVSLAGTTTLSGQVGLRHISNGRAGDSSRSLNTVYFSPMAAFSLGDDRRLIIAPRAWFYAGDLSDNPDIRRYRGNTELFVQIGEEEGLRLSTTTRISLSSGKSSFAADLSYPLRRIISGAPDFYLFGQSFVGYGENLLDYNVHTTRFRIGLAMVR